MPNTEKELEIRNLVVSFKTNKGIVHAVRNIDLSLNKGETLAIVGESGSGKSVSAKAILGIEAPNAIIEDGEILYQGQNLLTFTEDEFNRIRGNKVTMIFQDPMSSLDPIVKIGKQMTEATLLNGKLTQKLSKKEFNNRLNVIQKSMDFAGITKDRSTSEIATFKKFTATGNHLLASYNNATEYADSVIFDISQLKNDLLEQDKHDIPSELKLLKKKMGFLYDPYFLTKENRDFANRVAKLDTEINLYKNSPKQTENLSEALSDIASFLEELLKKESPNFFTLGYYVMAKGTEGVDFTDVSAMNKKLREVIDAEFAVAFIDDIATAIKAEAERSHEASLRAEKEVDEALKIFDAEKWDIKACKAEIKKLCAIVDEATDRLNLHTDRAIYTLRHTLTEAVNTYEATPLSSRTNAVGALKALKDLCQTERETPESTEPKHLTEKAVAIIDHLKDLSYSAVYHVTKQMAYDKAIRIMEEVGIRNPRERFEQYPFEFSGGMRQRIVIAIAIAANPDLLICDEPTTALDVTIQAQILELINKLKKKRNMSVIFITHDLGVVANVADKIAVMYAGKIVEKGTAEDIFYDPKHPYTWALLSSMPDLDTKDTLDAIPGTPPNMIYPPKGDAFAARNKYAMAIDFEEQPPMFKVSDSHYAATWLLHPDAPKVEPPKAVTDRIARMKAREEANNA